jgi:phenylpyruvate tautomerase PptA (4-oxalocrotonate tautomerase family)
MEVSSVENRGFAMPMIDVYAPDDLLPAGSDRPIGEALTRAVLRAEGVSAPGPFHLANTAAFIHRMDPAAVQTAAEAFPRVIRVQIITPPGALTRSGQVQLVKDVTGIMANVCGDTTQSKRTWVLLTEAAEGGWGIAGTAFGREEFAALAARKK